MGYMSACGILAGHLGHRWAMAQVAQVARSGLPSVIWVASVRAARLSAAEF